MDISDTEREVIEVCAVNDMYSNEVAAQPVDMADVV